MKPTNRPRIKQNEDKEIRDQLARVYESFFMLPKTMKEADKETGIMRENICWYCRTLRREGKLYVTGKRLCKITRHRANVYTTNPELVRASNQLRLFS